MKKINVLIADDHKIVRIGLKTLLSAEPDMTVVGEAEDGATAVRQAQKLRPDVVVMDLMMPESPGEAAIAELGRKMPEVKTIVLTSFGISDKIARALEAGAAGAVLKTADDSVLISAIRAVSRGETFLSKDVRQILSSDPPIAPLSQRQEDILLSMVRGLTNHDIALSLGVSEARVQQLVTALLGKIGAANRTEAVAIALRKHLLKI